MPRTKPVQVFEPEPLDLEAKIIKAVESVGPRNVALIARITGAHQETIRYKVKRQFAALGFRFQAEVDFRKLGLELYWGRFRVAPLYYNSAPRFFRALNESAFLVHFSKVMPQGHFNAIFTIPAGKEGEFRGFLDALKERKVITDFGLEKVKAERHKPFDPSFFNFQAGRWEVDWQRVKSTKGSALVIDREAPGTEGDRVDMLLIKELQKDSLQHVVGMAKSLGVNPKTMEYHYRMHVVKKALIPRYRIRWMGDIDKRPTHTMVFAELTFRGLDAAEYRKVQEAMSKVPFLWAEDLLQDGTYVATLSIPTIDFVETNGYVNKELGYLGSKVEVGVLNSSESSNFTIPYEKFVKGDWVFDAAKMETAVMKELAKGIEK